MSLVGMEGTLMDGWSEGLETRQALSPRSGLSREAEEKVRALIDTLRDERTSFEARSRAAQTLSGWALSESGPEVVPMLLALLRDSQVPDRALVETAWVLGKIESIEAVPALLGLLRNSQASDNA